MAAAQTKPARKKLVHHLDTPFSTAAWPEISQSDQDTMLELLCSLLSPIGQYRRHHVERSKGKRAKRRLKKPKSDQPGDTPARELPAHKPEPPELAAVIDVGFNSITRNLRPLSQSDPAATKEDADVSKVAYSMVFVARGDQSLAFNCSFPEMVGAASRAMPNLEPIRLVGLSKACSERLSESLGLARVSSLAIPHDAPGAAHLWGVVRDIVKPVQVPWLEAAAKNPTYRKTTITTA